MNEALHGWVNEDCAILALRERGDERCIARMNERSDERCIEREDERCLERGDERCLGRTVDRSPRELRAFSRT